MEEELIYKQALSRAMALCSQSEKCRADILMKLKQYSLTEEQMARAIAYLEKENFLDDARFARFYVNDRVRFNRWGKIKIGYMLRQKGVSSEIVNHALESINPELYHSILMELVKGKLRTVKGETDYERKGKVVQYAVSHGFEADLCFMMAEKVMKGDQD